MAAPSRSRFTPRRRPSSPGGDGEADDAVVGAVEVVRCTTPLLE